MNKNTLVSLLLLIVLGSTFYFLYTSSKNTATVVDNPTPVSITYKNTEYGFTFSLPNTWQGYSIVKDSWQGNPLTNTAAQSGPKLIIRNPKWTSSTPYEDLPILIFTISQWNAYLAENFSVSADPIKASELARNNVYVFALPARWDFDYSADYKEAEDIIAGKPLQTFNIGVSAMPNGKLNINLICERAVTYMKFVDIQSANTFISDCKNGNHPEVLQKYRMDMNLGDGAML